MSYLRKSSIFGLRTSTSQNQALINRYFFELQKINAFAKNVVECRTIEALFKHPRELHLNPKRKIISDFSSER